MDTGRQRKVDLAKENFFRARFEAKQKPISRPCPRRKKIPVVFLLVLCSEIVLLCDCVYILGSLLCQFPSELYESCNMCLIKVLFFLASLVAIIGFLLFALILETIHWGIWSFPHKI